LHSSREEIGNRLKQERNRLGLTQDDLATHLGIAKRTLAGYEAGTSDIGATVLDRAGRLGFDVLYLVAGERTPMLVGSLSAEELEFLNSARNLPQAEFLSLVRIATAMAATLKK
jgi:transcriptional regulator with XRE-family HTH domain